MRDREQWSPQLREDARRLESLVLFLFGVGMAVLTTGIPQYAGIGMIFSAVWNSFPSTRQLFALIAKEWRGK